MLTLNHQKIIRFIDTIAKKQKYGTLSLSVVLKNGVPIPETAQIIKNRRRKYKQASSPIDNLIRK